MKYRMYIKHMSFSRQVTDQSVATLERPKFGSWKL